MSRHLLVIGDFHASVSWLRPAARIDTISQLAGPILTTDPTEFDRIVHLPSSGSVDEWIDAARYLDRWRPISGVCAFSDAEGLFAAEIAKDLQLPWNSSDTAIAVNDKSVMRERFTTAGLPDVRNRRVNTLAELQKFMADVGGPIVVKPTTGHSSIGVSIVEDPDDLVTAWEVVNAEELTSGVLVEERLTGTLITVEMFSEPGQHGLVGTTQLFFEPESRVELGVCTPAPLPDAALAEAVAAVRAGLTALGVEYGPTHTEVMLTPAGPRIIETHIRPAGSRIPDLIADTTGVHPIVYTVWQALGATSLLIDDALEPTREPESAAAASWYVAPEVTGEVVRVSGTAAAAGAPGVVESRFYVHQGQAIKALTSNRDLLGYVRTRADDPRRAVELARAAIAKVEISVRAQHDPFAPAVGLQ